MRLAVVLLFLGACDSCKNDSSKPTPTPPPTSSTSSTACASGGGKVDDTESAAFFPQTVASYCVDPQGDAKTYGEKGKLGIDALCNTALDGGCEEYKSFGVTRSVIIHYVEGNGAGSVEVFLSKFAADGAYAIMTTRLNGETDPADPHAPRPMIAGGLGALGTGKAYAWKGPYFLELTYSNDQQTPEQMKKASDTILPNLAREITAKLPDDPRAPASVRALPQIDRIPNGVLYYPKDALGVKGAGAGTVGFYQSDKRYRLAAFDRPDEDLAKDCFRAFRSLPGALPITTLWDDAVQITIAHEGHPKVEWIVARRGNNVFAFGDEEFGVPPGQAITSRYPKDEKITKMKLLFGSK